MGGPLSPERQAKLDQLKEQMPEDLVPGFTVQTTGAIEPESPWVKRMSKFSKDLGANAHAYFNYDVRGEDGIKKQRRKPRRILSAEGFPPWVTVSYAYPPPFSFKTPYGMRDLKHFVMHSFGHGWHAGRGPKNRKGWMNSPRKGRGVIAVPFEGQTVYIPRGSDPESMAHFTRFSAGLRACLNTAAQATAHFFIDREGNLVVVGDCNDIMWTSQGVSLTSVGVEMEEAFYVLKDTKGRGNSASWKAGGRPKGTAGNIEYFAYSPKQMLTLSIIIRKLEMRYPQLKERNISFKPRSFKKKDAAGYTIHDFIKGSHHLDISPHFLTQDLWNAFFELVDAQDHITKDMCFRSANYSGSTSGEVKQKPPLSQATLTAMTERLYNNAQERGVAQDRTANLAVVTKAAVSETVGKNAAKASKQVAQQVATTVKVAQQTQNPIVELPQKISNACGSEHGAGSDDMWFTK